FAAPGCGLTPLLHGARRHVSAHVDDNLCVTPAHNALVSTTDGDLTLSGPKPVMAGDGLQVIGGGVRRGAGVRRILNRLITQSCDGQLVALRAYPRPNAIAIHFLDGRCSIRVRTIWWIVALGERRCWNYRRVQVGGIARHQGPFIAEVAIIRVVVGISDELSWVSRIRNRTRIVHAENHHVWPVPRDIRRVHLPRRGRQPVERAPLVGVHARNFDSVVVPDAYRHVDHSELLAESRVRRVKFRSEVIRNEPGIVSGGRSLRPDEEIRVGLHLVIEGNLFAVAQRTQRAGKRRYFAGFRGNAQIIRHDAHETDAGRTLLDGSAGPETSERRAAQVGARLAVIGRVRNESAIRERLVVGSGGSIANRGSAGGSSRTTIGVCVGTCVRGVPGIDGRLVRNDENIAEAAKLCGYWGDEVIADEKVEVFFLIQFPPWGY